MSGASHVAAGGSARDIFAGAAAGAIAASIFCPLEVIKKRLQADRGLSGPKGRVIITSLLNIAKNDGRKGLFSGLSPTILALSLDSAVQFPVRDRLKGLVHSHVDNGNQVSTSVNSIVAVVAGAAGAIGTNPLWVVVTRRQTQPQGTRPEPLPHALSRIAREEGLRGLYSGILPSFAGLVHVAIFYPAFEMIKQYLARKDNTAVDQLSSTNVAIAASMSKLLASAMTFPHEVVRTKLQEKGHGHAGVIDCAKKVYRKDGIPGFYRGFFPNLPKTILSGVVTHTGYEVIRRYLLRALPPDEKLSQSHPHSQSHLPPEKPPRN